MPIEKEHRPTPEAILLTLFVGELAGLAHLREELTKAARLSNGNPRQRVLRKIFEGPGRA